MSTQLYNLIEPWSSIRLEERGGNHFGLTLWERGANVGTLTISREFVDITVNSFRGECFGQISGYACGPHFVVYAEPTSNTIIDEKGDLYWWATYREKYPHSPEGELHREMQRLEQMYAVNPFPALKMMLDQVYSLWQVPRTFDERFLKEIEALVKDMKEIK